MWWQMQTFPNMQRLSTYTFQAYFSEELVKEFNIFKL